MKLTIDIEDERLSALFTRAATTGSLENLLQHVLECGACVNLMQNGKLLKKFDSPDQLIEFVNSILVLHLTCKNCGHKFECAPESIGKDRTTVCPQCCETIQLS